METVELKTLKEGDFFKRKNTAVRVYSKGLFDRSKRLWSCPSMSPGSSGVDGNQEIFLKGDSLVFVGFAS